MEREPKQEMSVEQYENLLKVSLTDITLEELKLPHMSVFSVTPEYTIFISRTSHEFLDTNYGADLDETLTEGNIRIHKDGVSEITFKLDTYQQNRPLYWTEEELGKLKKAVMHKLSDFVK
jgi:hypothetical protein